jgi:mannose-6-phosphate isomerase-like protein (cupin superfamily)
MQEFLDAFMNPANIPGHISYVLLILSMLMRKMHLLRMVAVSAGTFSAFSYASLGDWVSFFWEVVFTLVNLVQLVFLAIENRRGRFSAEEQMFIDAVLQGVERAHIRRLMKMGAWIEVGDGHELIHEDTRPSHLYYVVNGTARIVRETRQLSVVGPGDFLGEMSYLTGKNATATVVAETPMRFLAFEREPLRAYLSRNPEIRHALEAGFNRNLVDKLVKTNSERPVSPAAKGAKADATAKGAKGARGGKENAAG